LKEKILQNSFFSLIPRKTITASIPFKLADKSNDGINAIAPSHPINGTTTTTEAVFIIIPRIMAGINPHFLFSLFISPIAPPAKAILKAMGKWYTPSGNPFIIDVTICPIPLIKVPSHIPKYNAEKNPGLESKATDDIGLGG
jgi:hypothetical protein